MRTPGLTHVYDTLKFSNGRSYEKNEDVIGIRTHCGHCSFFDLNSRPFWCDWREVMMLLAADGKRQTIVFQSSAACAACLQHSLFHSTGGKIVLHPKALQPFRSNVLDLQEKRDCLGRDLLGCGGSRHRSNSQRWGGNLGDLTLP